MVGLNFNYCEIQSYQFSSMYFNSREKFSMKNLSAKTVLYKKQFLLEEKITNFYILKIFTSIIFHQQMVSV